MEQILQAFGIDWRLISIQIFNFTLLAVVLWYFLYTPILNLLKERQEKIEKGVRDAEFAEKALDLAEEEKKAILTEAQKEAEAVGMRAKEHAEVRASQIVKSAESKASHIVEEAETKSEQLKTSAIKESEAEIAKLAILAAERVLKEKNS